MAVQELQMAAADRTFQKYAGRVRGMERGSFARDGERMGKRGAEHAGG
jgi:hypothetical protein